MFRFRLSGKKEFCKGLRRPFFLFQRVDKFQRVFINQLQNPNACSILIIYIQRLQAQSHPSQIDRNFYMDTRCRLKQYHAIHNSESTFFLLPYQNRRHTERSRNQIIVEKRNLVLRFA